MVSYSLGPLEQEIMNCVWEHDEKTVRSVYSCLKNKRKIAYTTVMTIMTRLVDKGLLSKEMVGKAYVYSPKKSKDQVAKSMVGKIFDSLIDQFGEDALVAFSDELEKKKDTKK